MELRIGSKFHCFQMLIRLKERQKGFDKPNDWRKSIEKDESAKEKSEHDEQTSQGETIVTSG